MEKPKMDPIWAQNDSTQSDTKANLYYNFEYFLSASIFDEIGLFVFLVLQLLASRGPGEATEAASAYSRLWLADGQQIKLMGEGHCCQDCTGLEEARGAICN